MPVLLDPHLTQRFDLRQRPLPWWGTVVEHGPQQPDPVPADLQRVLLQRRLALGKPVIEGRSPVTLCPTRQDQRCQPFLVLEGKSLQRGSQGLGDELDPAQRPHCAQHMGRVRPDPATASLDQPGRHKVVHHHGQQPVGPVSLGHPVSELAEHGIVEP
ncbi:hypothetical protein OG965_38860 [Streptomyces sp. NBC_00224]|uniref:Uncharacterized protein n=1 Tax=Streptomyces sp. NBC_00060 TaxID=2975636 RepID=A0AAU2GR81_9ACTN